MGNKSLSCCKSKTSPSPQTGSRDRNQNYSTAASSSIKGQQQSKQKLSSSHPAKLKRKSGGGNNSHDNGDRNQEHVAEISQASHNLQHISERERDDEETDIDHPSTSPLTESTTNAFPCYYKRRTLTGGVCVGVGGLLDEHRHKASSCSTISIDESTISQPNLEQTIKCVSLAIYHHIKNRQTDNCAEIFDETVYPLKMPITSASATMNPTTKSYVSDSFQLNLSQDSAPSQRDQLTILDSQTEDDIATSFSKSYETSSHVNSHNQVFNPLNEPSQGAIYNFVRALFKAARLTSEYAIITLVYLERLMTYAEIDLTPKTWRRMFLGAIVLSSKVWEDQAIWNVDYAQILDEISVDDINEIERQFLEMIQFNMNVPASVYAKYYFHLRSKFIGIDMCTHKLRNQTLYKTKRNHVRASL